MLSENAAGLLWLLVGGVLLTVGDVIYKFWAKEELFKYYISGLAVYVIALLCLVQSFKSHNMAVASALFVIANIVTLALVSWYYFEEPLSIKQTVGICFSLIAVYFLA